MLLIAASAPESWIRKGNKSFADGRYSAALEFYQRAETATDDPGLVAFNKAAVYFRLGNFIEAARGYRQCLEDAKSDRRTRALYGLANSLVEQGRLQKGKRAVQLLQTASDRYRECIGMEAGLSEVERARYGDAFADARFNLQIAERLMEQKQKEPDGPTPPDVEPPLPPERRPPTAPEPGETDPTLQPGEPGDEAAGSDPRETEQFRPGPGNLPPLLDDKNSPTLTAEEARRHLLQAMKRIRLQRANRPATGGADPNTVRDW